jgi:hypothetical protein
MKKIPSLILLLVIVPLMLACFPLFASEEYQQNASTEGARILTNIAATLATPTITYTPTVTPTITVTVVQTPSQTPSFDVFQVADFVEVSGSFRKIEKSDPPHRGYCDREWRFSAGGFKFGFSNVNVLVDRGHIGYREKGIARIIDITPEENLYTLVGNTVNILICTDVSGVYFQIKSK